MFLLSQNDGKNKNQKEQQLEYGIYFDDDYDYMQHIKSSEEVSNIEWDFKERIYAPALTTDYKAEIPSSSKVDKTLNIIVSKERLGKGKTKA